MIEKSILEKVEKSEGTGGIKMQELAMYVNGEVMRTLSVKESVFDQYFVSFVTQRMEKESVLYITS